jgi:hypothetical protein
MKKDHLKKPNLSNISKSGEGKEKFQLPTTNERSEMEEEDRIGDWRRKDHKKRKKTPNLRKISKSWGLEPSKIQLPTTNKMSELEWVHKERHQNWKKRTELEIGGERTIRRGKKHQI